jgi:hypothetical protein
MLISRSVPNFDKNLSVSEFCLTTTWSIPAALNVVWACLIDTENWPLWWTYVLPVEQTAVGELSGFNNVRAYHWRTCLPYHLHLTLRVTEIQPLQWIAFDVAGDLKGIGRCQFAFQTENNQTQVVFLWQVKTCISWMNWLAVLARPIFVRNRDRILSQW